jgi:hypothetical protein
MNLVDIVLQSLLIYPFLTKSLVGILEQIRMVLSPLVGTVNESFCPNNDNNNIDSKNKHNEKKGKDKNAKNETDSQMLLLLGGVCDSFVPCDPLRKGSLLSISTGAKAASLTIEHVLLNMNPNSDLTSRLVYNGLAQIMYLLQQVNVNLDKDVNNGASGLPYFLDGYLNSINSAQGGFTPFISVADETNFQAKTKILSNISSLTFFTGFALPIISNAPFAGSNLAGNCSGDESNKRFPHLTRFVRESQPILTCIRKILNQLTLSSI